jgi:hypothetical protein
MGLDDDEGGPEWPTVYNDLGATLAGIVDTIRTKEATKRMAFSVPLVLGEGFVIGVNGCVSSLATLAPAELDFVVAGTLSSARRRSDRRPRSI